MKKLLTTAIVFAAQLAGAQQCLVVGVSDGDTLTARCGAPGAYSHIKIRLAAIDAPESRQPFGQRSKQALSSHCYMNSVSIKRRSTDRYGRTVDDVKCRGEDAGRHMVAGGWAWVYERYTTVADGGLFKLQREAQQQGAGLWTAREPIAPWEWRKTQRER